MRGGRGHEGQDEEAGLGSGKLISPYPAPLCWRNAKLSVSLLPPRSLPTTGPNLPTHLECDHSERFPPGWCEDLSWVSPGELWENAGGGSWSQSPCLSDGRMQCTDRAGARNSLKDASWSCSHADVHSPFLGPLWPPARLLYSQEVGACASPSLVGRWCPPGQLQPKFQTEEAAGGPRSGRSSPRPRLGGRQTWPGPTL